MSILSPKLYAVFLLLGVIRLVNGVEDMSDGKFIPCPKSPNCVSSQSTDQDHYIDPLRYQGELAAAKSRLLQVLNGLAGTSVETETDYYIHATFTSRIFRFVDDVEFYFDDAAKLIHLKSASRIGWSDLGANRRRCEAIRSSFK